MSNDFNTVLNSIKSGAEEVFLWDLTPAEAEQLIELNAMNRKQRDLSMHQYGNDMASNRWAYTGDTLKFSKQGKLLDGQHRLNGFVYASTINPEVRLKVLIVTGLEDEAQLYMDQGVRRTAGDNLSMKGIPYSNDVVSAARKYMLLNTGRLFENQIKAISRINNVEVQDWVLNNLDFAESVAEVIHLKKGIEMRGSVWLAAYVTFKSSDPQMAKEFVETLSTGEHLYVGHPIYTLRERLNRMSKEKLKASDRDQFAFIIMAWNAFVHGKTMDRLSRPRGGSWNKENFPVIETRFLASV